MSVKALQQRVNSLIKAGNKAEAADILFEYWADNDRSLPNSLAAIIEEISDVSQTAAYILAFSLPEEQTQEKERLLKFASTSSDEIIIAEANMDLTEIYVVRNDDELALNHLKIAAANGSPAARYMLSLALSLGKMGLEKDVPEGVLLLKGLIKEGYPQAKVTLARLMLSGTVIEADLDPFQLVTEASAEGDMEAMEMLLELGSISNGLPADVDPMLPYTVIPDGMKRPKLVRDALVHELEIRAVEAEEITAGLYGFSNWSLLANAANDPKKPKGKFDEELEPAERNERNRLLSSVFSFYVDCEEYVSDIAIDLLKPTAKGGKPSLKRLQERVDNCMVPIGSRTFSAKMDSLTDQFGGRGDFERSLRTARPARADVWLGMMESALGWEFDEMDPDADADGSWIGKTHSDDKRLFDVFISRVSFTPGDRSDEHVFKIQRNIQNTTQNAVLLFSKPLVHLPDPENDFGVLYGGLILNNGKWNDFVLRPEGGIDDAIAQNLTIPEEMSEKDVAQFAFEGAGSLGLVMANNIADEDLENGNRWVPFGNINGWTGFMPKETAQMLKSMRRPS